MSSGSQQQSVQGEQSGSSTEYAGTQDLFSRSAAGQYSAGAYAEDDDDHRSELGGVFQSVSATVPAPVSAHPPRVSTSAGVRAEGVTRELPSTGVQIGRGAVPVDGRKFLYDRTAGASMPSLAFGASKVDRMDSREAGVMLHNLHVQFGIDREPENILMAFDKALFFEHTVNGASLLQGGRGTLSVGESHFDISIVKRALGIDQRRFFRAFADEIAEVNREVIRAYDAYDPVLSEKHGQLMQVAVERGLQKYPHLAHDSSDAGTRLSVEERVAVMQSKRLVLESSVNRADALGSRVDEKIVG